MSTLLAEGNRRCTGRCHHSPGDPAKCGCICEGRLHGAGSRAVEFLVELVRGGALPAALDASAVDHLPATSFDQPLPGM